MRNRINVTRSSMPEFEEYCAEIRELWDSRWLTNSGIKHKQLEQMLKNYLQTQNITLFVNGHLALETVLTALNLNGEVITTPFTFASTTQAIIRCGLTPVFCDINTENYTIDTEKIEALITEKTCAILPVHVYGNICNVDEIARIAKKYNLKVIYDAAHAFGVTVNGTNVANFGDASMFSFHATKVFHTIEGGAVTYKDVSLSAQLDSLKNFGQIGEEVPYIGGNAKLNEFAAAMGICNLRHIGDEIAKRKLIAAHYCKRLNDVQGIYLCPKQKGVASNYAYFPVMFDGYKYDRDAVLELLAKENIFARKYFYPATNTFSAYCGLFPIQKTPVAEHISNSVLTLPLYADLSIEDVDHICDIILK